MTRSYSHYFKDVSAYDEIDVYRVLKLFDVTDPCVQHAVKKLLCAGKRGVKLQVDDVREALVTLERFCDMHAEDNAQAVVNEVGEISVTAEALHVTGDVTLDGKVIAPTEPTEAGKLGMRAGWSASRNTWVCVNALEISAEALQRFRQEFTDVQLTHYWAETSRSWIRDVFADYTPAVKTVDTSAPDPAYAGVGETQEVSVDMTDVRAALNSFDADKHVHVVKPCCGNCAHNVSGNKSPAVLSLCQTCLSGEDFPFFLARSTAPTL